MLGSIVLDASVIAAIFFDEDVTDEVREIVARYRPITVDWVYAEVGNIAWKRIAKFKKDPDVTKASVAKCLGYLESCSVFRGVELCESALELAVEHRITFYDALYVAASKKTGAPLYTFGQETRQDRECEGVVNVNQMSDRLPAAKSSKPSVIPVIRSSSGGLALSYTITIPFAAPIVSHYIATFN